MTKDFTKEVENFVLKSLPNDYLVGYPHIERVRQNALTLQKRFGGDKEIIEVSALLHDIGRIKDSVKHGKYGVEIAEEFLKKIGYSDDKIKKVTRAIAVHGREDWDTAGKPETLEEKILYDADKMDLVCVKWLFKVFLLCKTAGMDFQDAMKRARKILDENYNVMFFMKEELRQKYDFLVKILDEIDGEIKK
jgi:putative nucleotidyltransferase with HDIG domain